MKLGSFRSYEPHCSDESTSADSSQQDPTVRVTAGETLALLMHASRSNRAWLTDFADETLMVSRDLYEILLAYKRIATEERSRAA